MTSSVKFAIKKRIDYEKEVGFLLSGGLDSSSLIAYSYKHLEKINTFSVVFEDQKYNEENYQKIGRAHV